MWQASSTRFAPAARVRLVAIRLPIGSVQTSSKRPFVSRWRTSRTRSSRPGTPGASDRLFRKAIFIQPSLAGAVSPRPATRSLRRVSKVRFDVPVERLEAPGLGDIALRPQAHRLLPRRLVVHGAVHDDGDRGGLRVGADPAEDLQAVRPR